MSVVHVMLAEELLFKITEMEEITGGKSTLTIAVELFAAPSELDTLTQ